MHHELPLEFSHILLFSLLHSSKQDFTAHKGFLYLIIVDDLKTFLCKKGRSLSKYNCHIISQMWWSRFKKRCHKCDVMLKPFGLRGMIILTMIWHKHYIWWLNINLWNCDKLLAAMILFLWHNTKWSSSHPIPHKIVHSLNRSIKMNVKIELVELFKHLWGKGRIKMNYFTVELTAAKDKKSSQAPPVKPI